MRMDDIAEGIAAFLRSDQGVAPIVVRMAGTKEEEGRAILHALGIAAFDDLAAAVHEAVSLTKRGRRRKEAGFSRSGEGRRVHRVPAVRDELPRPRAVRRDVGRPARGRGRAGVGKNSGLGGPGPASSISWLGCVPSARPMDTGLFATGHRPTALFPATLG